MFSRTNQVVGIENEAKFILALQDERSAVALAVFLFNDTSSAEEKVLRAAFDSTDDIITKIKWGQFGIDKIFSSKLRFQAGAILPMGMNARDESKLSKLL